MSDETTINIAEEWRKGYEAGYAYGRIDALGGRAYDDRTPLQKRKEEDRNVTDNPES